MITHTFRFSKVVLYLFLAALIVAAAVFGAVSLSGGKKQHRGAPPQSSQSSQSSQPKPSPSGPAKPLIIVDPGHGGIDGGAVGVDGTPEKGINLSIGLMLRDMLVADGYKVLMTRETDVSIYSPGATTVAEKKTSDLHNRMAMMTANPGALFVSIHQNTYTSSKYTGTQVFYGGKVAASSRLAQCIQTSMRTNLQPTNTRVPKQSTKDLYLLYYAPNPAVMVECGFMTNAAELKKLEDPSYQKQLARYILAGIDAYCAGGSGMNPGSTVSGTSQ